MIARCRYKLEKNESVPKVDTCGVVRVGDKGGRGK